MSLSLKFLSLKSQQLLGYYKDLAILILPKPNNVKIERNYAFV